MTTTLWGISIADTSEVAAARVGSDRRARYGGSMKLSGKGVLRRFGRVTIAIVSRVCDVRSSPEIGVGPNLAPISGHPQNAPKRGWTVTTNNVNFWGYRHIGSKFEDS